MTITDSTGNSLSTGNRASADRYDAALTLLHGYFGDPLLAIDRTLAEDPEFTMGHCFRAALMVLSTERGAEPMLRESVEAAERLGATANDRERAHMAAARAWLEGDFAGSVQRYGEIVQNHPRDALALQVAHIGDFFLGQSRMLRDRIAAVLPAWNASTPGYGFVLGMHAFGLEECAEYGQAEETGRRALQINPRDPWAVHAVAHVMEMQGRQPEGIRWLEDSAGNWAPDNGFAYHNWWHLALLYLDLGDHARVLKLYDEAIRADDSQIVLQMIDASAMLWRLHLRGIDVGDRWKPLLAAWTPRIDERYYAFNDAHAMMAFAATGSDAEARRLIEALEHRVDDGGTNAMMTRDVGLPLCRALAAFGRGDYSHCMELLLPIRFIAHRFGGSHAQRDLIHLTLIEAALRANRTSVARAIADERVHDKPSSPFNWNLLSRARDLGADAAGAAEANQHALDVRSNATARLRAMLAVAA